MSSGGVSGSILERNCPVFPSKVLFWGDSSIPVWKMTGVCEKAGILGKKAAFGRISRNFWGNVCHRWEKPGLCGRKCRVFGRNLVYVGEKAM